MTDLFEDFAHGPLPYAQKGGPADDALASFDKGYKAGWDDASKAHGDSQSKASSVLTRNLEALEFTLIESRGMVLASISPVLREIAETLLPGLAAQALQAQLICELEALVTRAMPDTINIDVSPADKAAVKALLASEDAFEKVTVSVRDTLGDGQVNVSCEDVTKRIDVPAALKEIEEALRTLETQSMQPEPEQAHAG